MLNFFRDIWAGFKFFRLLRDARRGRVLILAPAQILRFKRGTGGNWNGEGIETEEHRTERLLTAKTGPGAN